MEDIDWRNWPGGVMKIAQQVPRWQLIYQRLREEQNFLGIVLTSLSKPEEGILYVRRTLSILDKVALSALFEADMSSLEIVGTGPLSMITQKPAIVKLVTTTRLEQLAGETLGLPEGFIMFVDEQV